MLEAKAGSLWQCLVKSSGSPRRWGLAPQLYPALHEPRRLPIEAGAPRQMNIILRRRPLKADHASPLHATGHLHATAATQTLALRSRGRIRGGQELTALVRNGGYGHKKVTFPILQGPPAKFDHRSLISDTAMSGIRARTRPRGRGHGSFCGRKRPTVISREELH